MSPYVRTARMWSRLDWFLLFRHIRSAHAEDAMWLPWRRVFIGTTLRLLCAFCETAFRTLSFCRLMWYDNSYVFACKVAWGAAFQRLRPRDGGGAGWLCTLPVMSRPCPKIEYQLNVQLSPPRARPSPRHGGVTGCPRWRETGTLPGERCPRARPTPTQNCYCI